ncbi:hypothetical protein DWW31_16645 [Clostridium sp. AF15-17LB]|nr:hypothetical protein DWW31_16645 [Clostridium sp. AF15-17LB]
MSLQKKRPVPYLLRPNGMASKRFSYFTRWQSHILYVVPDGIRVAAVLLSEGIIHELMWSVNGKILDTASFVW